MASKCSWFWFLFVLCLCWSSYGLSPPHGLHWTIKGACVHVSWKHSHGDEPIDGYYVSLQALNSKKELQAPDFVHVTKGVRSTDIQGLWPDAEYKVKVVAFAKQEHAESPCMIIKTHGLEMLQARHLTISSISTTSALFQWEHDAKSTIHDTQFRLMCRGVRQYIDSNNKVVEESDDFEYTPYASSQGKETYFPTSLQANTKYTCHITTVAETVESPPTPDVTFNTAYGAPVPPPQPKVVVYDNSSFAVFLYHSIERFGPISHYKVFAVPVKEEAERQSVALHYVPTVKNTQLLTQAVLPQLLAKDSKPAPFLVGTYTYKELPRHIAFNGNEMRMSFKPNTHYSFITVVFTKSEVEEMEGFRAFSAPANPPVFISKDLEEDWIQLHSPAGKHFTIIVACTLVSVILLFIAAFLIAFASNYYQGKKRDAFYFTVNDGDSSEEEIFSKSDAPSSFQPSPKIPYSPETAPLLALSPAPGPSQEQRTYTSDSPAKIPVNVSPNPMPQEPANENPLFVEERARTIDEPPVTMYEIRDYLASRANRPVSSPQPAVGPEPVQPPRVESLKTLDQGNDGQESSPSSETDKSGGRKRSNIPVPVQDQRGFSDRHPPNNSNREYASLRLQDIPPLEDSYY